MSEERKCTVPGCDDTYMIVHDFFGDYWCWGHYTGQKEPETNSRVDKAERRLELSCSFCRPHKGENKTYKKHGVKKKRVRR